MIRWLHKSKTNILTPMTIHVFRPRFSPAQIEGNAPPPWKIPDIFSRRYRACLKNVNMPNQRVFCPLDGAIFP